MQPHSKDALPAPASPGAEAPPAPVREAPYIPSPPAVIDEMLRVAGLGKGDLLYDLGCGDGRIVIAAALKYGVCGVGVDANPRRIQECNENARKAGVGDRVRFLRQNLFDVDISAATVMTLYLLSAVNLKLRPKLLRELKAGARVVSHEFGMGEWPPDRILEAEGYPVYYWMVPAQVKGLWEVVAEGGRGKSNRYVLRLDQHFQAVSGMLEWGGTELPVTGASLKGDVLQFTVRPGGAGPERAMRFHGSVDGNIIRGLIASDGSGREAAGWTARRIPDLSPPGSSPA